MSPKNCTRECHQAMSRFDDLGGSSAEVDLKTFKVVKLVDPLA